MNKRPFCFLYLPEYARFNQLLDLCGGKRERERKCVLVYHVHRGIQTRQALSLSYGCYVPNSTSKGQGNKMVCSLTRDCHPLMRLRVGGCRSEADNLGQMTEVGQSERD